MAPSAGDILDVLDVLEFASIWSFESPESAHCARSMNMGKTVLTAAAFMQTGPRIFGFQNSGSLNALSQARSTMQTNPFVPFATVSKPCAPSTMTPASFEIDGAAALRASTISAELSIMYWLGGAMRGYGAVSPRAAPVAAIRRTAPLAAPSQFRLLTIEVASYFSRTGKL